MLVVGFVVLEVQNLRGHGDGDGLARADGLNHGGVGSRDGDESSGGSEETHFV